MNYLSLFEGILSLGRGQPPTSGVDVNVTHKLATVVENYPVLSCVPSLGRGTTAHDTNQAALFPHFLTALAIFLQIQESDSLCWMVINIFILSTGYKFIKLLCVFSTIGCHLHARVLLDTRCMISQEILQCITLCTHSENCIIFFYQIFEAVLVFWAIYYF